MRLILIRHGESRIQNREVIAGVRSCQGLTDRGVRQAQMLAERVSYSGRNSRLHRAAEQSGAASTSDRGRIDKQSTGARDRGTSRVEGNRRGRGRRHQREEYRSRHGEFNLIEDPDRPFAPGGESWSQYLNRVRLEMDRLAQRFSDQTVVAVTHAGFIVVSIQATFDIPQPGTQARLEPDNASLTEWRFDQGKWQLQRYNDAYHSLRKPEKESLGSKAFGISH